MAKRLYRRFAVELQDETGDVRLEDLSLMGMRIVANRSLKLEELFETTIRGVDGPIQVRGRIVRASLSRMDGFRYEYGASMVPVSEDEERRLEHFIQHLSRSSQPLPESPEPEDVVELRGRIATLKADLAELMERHQATVRQRDELAAAREVVDEEIDETAFATAFGARRFRHLVRLGQPLMPVVPEPLDGFSGRRFRLVGPALRESFDLSSVTKAVSGALTPLAIVETLFDLYEDHRIDFA